MQIAELSTTNYTAANLRINSIQVSYRGQSLSFLKHNRLESLRRP